RGVAAIIAELAQSFHYIGTIPVLLGIAWSWQRLRTQAGFWIMATLCTLHAAALCLLVVKVGYVSDRHVMILVLCGSYFLAGGLCELPGRVSGWLARLPRAPDTNSAATAARYGPASIYALGLTLIMVAACLAKALQPLHHNRVGHQAAGRWLATQL